VRRGKFEVKQELTPCDIRVTKGGQHESVRNKPVVEEDWQVNVGTASGRAIKNQQI
jgi:hypothetical protein